MSLRSAAREGAYRSGAMGIFHRASHKECLTALMFHRVQPGVRLGRSSADPIYTVEPELLAQIVRFLKRNYTIVDMRDVLASLRRERALPPRPALITFDDGWRDNLEWALPTLGATPWTLFVAADALSEPGAWWQEVLLWALRTGRASYRDLWAGAAPDQTAPGADGDMLALLTRYGALAPEDRRRALLPYEKELCSGGSERHMLNGAELDTLRSGGVAIGSHGASHLPLSLLDDPDRDLSRSEAWLRETGGLPVMSFPHGRYNAAIVARARDLGYEAIFTSDTILNPCPGGWLQGDLIGRISFSAAAICDRDGALVESKLAAQLYLREIACPVGQFA